MSQSVTHKLEKDNKGLSNTFYHDSKRRHKIPIVRQHVILYHKIARGNSFCKKLYPCAPIVRLVIFLMPTDQVMAFLCFISDDQSVDMSGQVWGGGRGGHN